MTQKLPAELQSVMRQIGHPLEVVDDMGCAYVVVPKSTFLHLRNLCEEVEVTTRSQLRQLIQDGIDSGPGIPADQVFAQRKQTAARIEAGSK